MARMKTPNHNRSEQTSFYNRRKFLSQTGWLAVGTALTKSLAGAESDRTNAPTPATASRLGFKNDYLGKLGYLNARKYAKGDGITDDTDNLRTTLAEASALSLVLYLPPGTYLVSDTLDCKHERPATGKGYFNHGDFLPAEEELFKHAINGFFIQGDPDHPPVIKLRDNTAAFGDESRPRIILRFYEDADSWKPIMKNWVPPQNEGIREFGAGMMNHFGVSSISIDCGSNNPGAVGFKCWGAQGIYAENITIRAYGALAGVFDLIGNGGYMANIAVYGGKYGVWARYGQPGCIAGLTLIDQEEAAIRQELRGWPYSIVGFRIVKQQGPVVVIDKKGKQNAGSHLSLVDGTVELQTRSAAFVIKKNEEGRAGNLYLRDVYVRNADLLVRSSADESLKALQGEWSHIHEYCGTSIDGANIVNGQRTGMSALTDSQPPPASIMRKHMLSREDIPFALDRGVVSVGDPQKMGKLAARGDGKTDDTASIQYAVDHYDKVFLPKGHFLISSPIALRTNTRLFGLTSGLSWLRTDSGKWRSPENKTAIDTPDEAKATCMVSQISVFSATNKSGPEFRTMVWKAGRNSVFKNVVAAPFLPAGDTSHLKAVPELVLITGNGGGRRYGDCTGAFLYTLPEVDPSYRHQLILDTKEPLRFYAYNPEHAHSSLAEVEIRNSRRVEIYGVKTEGGGDVVNPRGLFLISNCSDIFITAVGNNGKKTSQGSALYRMMDCENIALTTVDYTARSHGDYLVLTEERNGGFNFTIPMPSNIGVFRRGDPERYAP